MATIKISDDSSHNVCITDRYTEFTSEMIEKYEKFTKYAIKSIKKKNWKNGLRRK